MDHLSREKLCKRCRATDAVNNLFDEATLRAQPKLVGLRDHLLEVDATYLLRIKKGSNTWQLLVRIAALREPVTHADLNEMGSPRSTSQVRSLLVSLGALDKRDEYAGVVAKVAAEELGRLPHRTDQLALRCFIRWRQQHRRSADPLTHSQSSNDRRELRVILSLVHAFNEDGTTVENARQEVLERWAQQSSSAYRARRFLIWCARAGINRELIPPPYSRQPFGIGGTLSNNAEAALQRILARGGSTTPRMRLAVLLTIAYGIRVHRIASIRLNALRVVDGRAAVRLGSADLELPAAAAPWLDAILTSGTVRHRVGGSRHDGTWMFPGYRHGDHILPSSLAAKLRHMGVSPGGAHQVSTAPIVTQVPPAVVARLLGVSVKTAADWKTLVGAPIEHR